MYTVVFQKRGLPHAHLLIILLNDYKLLTTEAYDEIIRAELPDANADLDLRKLVLKHMMHGPCGSLDPTNSCMRKKIGSCKFKYPKMFADQTSKGNDSYPIYRRRNTGEVVKVRGHDLDNSWVVPYNPYLLGKFNCHINVEVCSDIKVVKYLYKYICKGHDKIVFSVQNNDANIEIDEVNEYRSARWVSPPEAVWRLFRFPISKMSPNVCRLQVHLDGQQLVSFKKNMDINTIVNNPMVKKTMLTEFFYMNKTNENAMKLNLLYREFPEYFVWSSSDKFWALRQCRCTVDRVVTCHPTEGERYYLRLLLMHVRGPTSYEDLLMVNGEPCSSFRESVEKKGLLQYDNSLTECMSEAASYQMPYSLRRLFATLLVHCNPTNPRELWEQFEESMSEDYKLLQTIEIKEIRYQVLNHINDILHSMGHNVNEYQLIPQTIRTSAAAKEAKEIHFERTITVSEDEVQLHKRLNKNQLTAYDVIINRVFSNKAGAFFIDGPGGTGKTFLYRALLATVRSMGYIALATATSGVAASILPGGRTAHSRFKIPIDINENVSCNISKQSALASLIRDAKLIVWDEASMANKRMLEFFDLLLKDLMDTNILFGRKVVVFGGDFRQTLPVVRNGKKEDFINQSLLYCSIWAKLEKIQLCENMRAKTDPTFCDYLLRIRNGQERLNATNNIEVPNSLIVSFTTERESLDKLFTITYPYLNSSGYDAYCTDSHVILTTKNNFVDEINDMLITQFPGKARTFVGIDETIESDNQSQFEDLLHTLNPTSLPPYILSLKKNCPIMLLRNLNPYEGLCNGTRLNCCEFKTHVLSAKIATGDFKNTHVFIPRIPLLSSNDEKLPVQFKRTQFPVRLCYAMTINKAQGQTLDFVGIYLREPVFSHGQLYVALSRAKSSNCVKLLIRPPTPTSDDDHSTCNIVYDEIIQKAIM
uniref:ATP-dependent DNA helicase n=1 Tax=Nicotiana tabacum TaxID=4097 RepID=A0A1S4A4H3_TOBAC|nr:PREDICTED: uncharacterized protein LOC107793670 isoform X1 [Nicotiana tabacum]XP_016471558.1 PREDICTED: uncharacterized protein LOC107793670 isoform X1 [Nicotiana tabacum]XP_016471563.1 PREDICTED: uncharacterized protein LOC107793670 isoform X1 [Nicotiana tabacum]XP_016471572.1 PREDICTED: uncharacterized protein LOC107793670 isoform X1 [Nicotiana tabacum]XP_016471583.1 PREDICTED: uncharacterized protein LOC107793670 isoform X1 [Nicotiana tabacum]XP_016471591.1 PREDICTED: uncharacterized pro